MSARSTGSLLFRSGTAGALLSAGALLTAGALLNACATPYVPPTSDQPHAVVKYRRVYQKTKGVTLREVLTVEEHPAFRESVAVSLVKGPRSDALLVHPAVAEIEAESVFFHIESRRVQENYTEQVPYMATESYSCGTGTSYRTCTRSVTRYRSQHKTRWVTKQVQVVDSRCEDRLWLKPAEGASYLVELRYRDHQICNLSCYQQIQGEGDEFQNVPCPEPSALERRHAEDAR